jgi:hypothetical protein
VAVVPAAAEPQLDVARAASASSADELVGELLDTLKASVLKPHECSGDRGDRDQEPA